MARQDAKNFFMVYEAFCADKCVEIECFFTAFEAVYQSDYSFEGEMHDFWEVFCVLEGDVCVSADERIEHLTKDDVIFHKPMELHRFHIENGHAVSAFTMSFSACGPVMSTLENCVRELSPLQKQELLRLVTILRKDAVSSVPCKGSLMELEKNSLAFRRFTCLTELFLLSVSDADGIERMAVELPEAVIYRRAVQVMETYAHDWPSVPDIAAICNVSVSYLKNIFRKYAGLGVHQYFLKIKIIHASRMLKAGQNVVEIAEALSFSSPNYFSMVYKREVGMTATEYKRAGVSVSQTPKSNYVNGRSSHKLTAGQ